jgi:transposase
MKPRKPYPMEFRQEAVKLVTEPGMSRTQVARDRGIDPDTLRRWLQIGTAAATGDDGQARPAELVRLRRENEQLRMERDILKKALGICSRMPQ